MIQNFYCSDDSFQTPLESPCVEQKHYFNGCKVVDDDDEDDDTIVATDNHRPKSVVKSKMVLTPPDVNEAFAIKEPSHCQ